jgi:hypothetical protein
LCALLRPGTPSGLTNRGVRDPGRSRVPVMSQGGEVTPPACAIGAAIVYFLMETREVMR